MNEERKHLIDGKSSVKRRGKAFEKAPEEIVERLLLWISEGKTLREFCRLPDSPSFRTIYDWSDKDKDFASRLAQAREIGHDAIADETMEIIDSQPEFAESDSGRRRDTGHVAWMKNRVELRLKLLAVWNPKKYGNRTTVAGDPENPLIEPLDDAQRAAKVQAIMAAAAARKAQDGGV